MQHAGSFSKDSWGERLPRRLGLTSAVAVIVGTTIGSGIFRTPAVVAERLPQEWAFALVWVIGGLLALAGALGFAELAAMFPRSGGFYVYIREAFGETAAFLFGWAELLIIRPASYGAISIVCAEYVCRLLGLDGETPVPLLWMSLQQLVAAGLIAAVAVINIRGVDMGARLQNVSTVLKVAALLVLVAVGLLLAAPTVEAPAGTALPSTSISLFGLALVSVLWAYDGFADLAFVGGEVRDPERNMPRALLLGTLAIIAIYLAVNLAYARTIPLAEMPGAQLIAADVAIRLVGNAGLVFVTVAVAVSTFGSLNGSTMTGPRIFYAMAEDGLFFRRIARVHPRYGTPADSIAMMAALGILFVSVRSFAQLADQFVIGIWPFYALGMAALFRLRIAAPDRHRPYSAWGYPWVPGLFLAGAVALLLNYLVSEPVVVLVNVAVVLAGWPVWIVRRRRRDQPSAE